MTQPVGPALDALLANLPKKAAYIGFLGPVNEKNCEALIARANYEIQNGASVLHLALTSFGGLVSAGVAAYNLLKGLPIELITYNVGNVGSIANAMFLAGKQRYATPFSSFYFHGTTGGQPNSNAAMLQSAIEGIDVDNDRTVELIVAETCMSPADARGLLTSVGTTIDAAGAKARGIAHDVREWKVPAGSSFFQIILPAQ